MVKGISTRHNSKAQALADRCAKENGKFCASYMGRMGETFVYEPRYADSVSYDEGLPQWILVSNGMARYVCSEESFEIVEKMTFRDFTKGRKIFQEYQECYILDQDVNDDIREIVEVAEHHPYNDDIGKRCIYEYLELADRLQMRLTVKTDSTGYKYLFFGGNINMNNQRIAPDMIQSLAENEIFVFGSNLAGMHGGGAAYIAWRKFGAVMGQGVGLQGQSYAIPTMQGDVETIQPYVDEFIAFAKENLQLKFLVTRIGCGIAGFREEEIAPLFRGTMEVENICLPDTFWEVLRCD